MMFTNSPFEKMMQEKPYVPHSRRHAPPKKCEGCPKWWTADNCGKCTHRRTSGQVVPKLN